MFEIIRKEKLTDNIYLMDVYCPWIAPSAKPGQFVIVIVDEKGERVPLTICDYNIDKEYITLVIQAVGKSTIKMVALNDGDCLKNVVGPLGKESEMLSWSDEEKKNKKILFVAGGVGAAPVYPQVKWAIENKIKLDVIIGTKTKDTLILEKQFKNFTDIFIYTDDGTYGTKGMVTEGIRYLIEEKGNKYDEVIAIGPMIMMKFISFLTKKYEIKTTVSLNTLMVDGTGMCGACRVSVGGKTKFTCVDGPEFDAHLVDWDEAICRQGMYRSYEIGRNSEKHNCNLTEIVDNFVCAVKNKRVPVREQKPEIRITNFEEVCYGYNESEAMEEATRCLNCKKPFCVNDCPVAIDIPGFINEIKNGNFLESFKILSKNTSLPAVCGRVCPQESQCEGICILGKKGEPVAIGKLERFAADWARENNIKIEDKLPEINKKIAVVGAGPSGLTCAGELAKLGYKVTIFEGLHEPGGVLVYGIPEFRLPKETVVKTEIENVKNLGVEIITDVIIGRSITIDDLFTKENFQAVYIASGAGLPKFMNIPGINLNGVLSSNELLTRSNLMKAFKYGYDTPVYPGTKTIIVGGGNVAMDAARTAKRLGADTHVVYRRSQKEMPARVEEIHHAIEEGIIFHFMTNPVEIIGDKNGWVKAIKCIKIELGEPDESGRRSPIEIKGSEFEIETDCIVMSLGTGPNKLLIDTTEGLEAHSWGGIIADKSGQTTRKGVFAGGDAVIGAATVILAMGAGKTAAESIDKYLKEN
ncbi:MAG: NADPH-dependent glutamate synthase [Bacteroidales bacterium]|nr:NADPH-dependent glutamate synthase [Bacteroidales bacterium]